MRKQWVVLGMLALGLAGCANSHPAATKEKGEAEEGDEQKITFAQVPPAAQKTLTSEAHGNRIDTVDQETDEGKTLYEADVMLGGKNYEIKVAPDGTLLSKKLDQEDEGKEKASAKKGEKEDDEKAEKGEKGEKD